MAEIIAWLLTRPLRFPRAALAILLLGAGLCAVAAGGLQADFGIEQLLPGSDPEVRRYQDLSAAHGRDDNTVYVFLTRTDLFTPRGLYGVVALSRELGDRPFVEEVVSLANVPMSSAGASALELGAPFDPDRVAEMDFDAIRRQVVAERVFRRRLVSEDGRTTLLAVRIRDAYRGDAHRSEVVKHVEEVIEVFRTPDVEFHVTGNAPNRNRYVEFIRRDNRLLLPGVFALLAAALVLAFRRLTWAVLPLVGLAVSILFTFGFMRLAGKPVTLLTSAIPVLIVIVGLSDAIHLLARYEEELAAAPGHEDALARAVTATARACLFSTVTTAVGFFVLPTTGIPMLADFGLAVGVGVLVAYVVTLALLPAALALVPPPARPSRAGESAWLGRLAAWVTGHRGGVLVGTLLAVAALAALGIPRVRVESRILDDLPPGHELLATRSAIEKRMGGNSPLTFVVHPAAATDGAAEDPELLRAVLRFQDELTAADPTGVFSSSVSAADFIGMAWRSSGSPGELPVARQDVQRMVRLVGEATMGRLLDSRRRSLVLDVRVYDRGTRATFDFLDHARRSFERTVGSRARLEVQGFTYLAHRVHGRIVWTSITSFTLDFVIVSVLVLAAFRSLRLAVMAIVPNLVPLVVTLAFMGMAGIDLRISSSIVFSIVYGIAIDDTVHLLARYQEERGAGAPARLAMIRAVATTGRAMVLMAFVLAAGFSILTLSQFQPTRVLGLLMGVTVAAGLVADLLLLPALLGRPGRASRAA
jgi:hydrophobe/amphiphile efflux-3 (HAE3) family protein